MSKPDLNKLKTEIDNRKRERNVQASPMSVAASGNVAPRDAFLYGLLESLNTGKETASTSLMKTVENTVAAKKGEATKFTSQPVEQQEQRSHIPIPPRQQNTQRLNEVGMSPERDDMYFAEMERRRKMGLAEQIQSFNNTPMMGTPMNNNLQMPMQMPMQLNEGYLIENVKKVVDNYLNENLAPIFEEAIKSTIIEMYAIERIKDVLTENKEMIKSIVIETIKEIQQRSKAKAQ